MPSRPSVRLVSPLLPTFFCGCCPNTLPPSFPPLSALRLVPVVLWGSCLPLPPLPIPCVPVAQQAGPLAGSTSPGTPPLFRHSPMPFCQHLPPSSSRLHFTPGLRRRSQPILTVSGIPRTPQIAAFTYARFISWHSPLPLTLSHLVPLSCLPPHLVLFTTICSLALCPHFATCFPFSILT